MGNLTQRRHSVSREALRMGCAGLALLGLIPGLACAETATTASAAPAEAPSQLETLVVTAQRREEKLQDVPIVVTAISAEKIADLSIRDTKDLQRLTPGLVIGQIGVGGDVYLRGVGVISTGFGVEPDVATYIDGFYQANADGAVNTLNNVERVEVLKGPQGTLFGRNSVGGVINIVTKQPTQKRQLDLSVGYGNYDTVDFRMYATGGITDKLAASVAFSDDDQHDGFGRNIFTNTKAFYQSSWAFMGKVKWDPDADTSITLQGSHYHYFGDIGVNQNVAPGFVAITGEKTPGYLMVNHLADTNFTDDTIIGLTINRDLDWAKLMFKSGYVRNSGGFNFDQNGIIGLPVSGLSGVFQIVRPTESTFTQEIQLLSPTSSKINWIVGGYFLQSNGASTAQTFATPCVVGACAVAPMPSLTVSDSSTTSYAAFAQTEFNLTSRLQLTLGARYTYDTKRLNALVTPIAGQPNSVAVLPPTTVTHAGDPIPIVVGGVIVGFLPGIPTEKSWGEPTWRVALDYKLTDSIMAYALQSRGFKSGTYSTAITSPPANPEVIDDYEVGVKSELFERRLRANVGLFYYDYRGIQLKTVPAGAPLGFTITSNAASARIQGVDADFEASVTDGLVLGAAFEVLDARYTGFHNTSCAAPAASGLGVRTIIPCDLTGNHLVRAPKFSSTLQMTYTKETPVGQFVFNINDNFQSKFYFNSEDNLSNAPYHLVSASLRYTPEFAKNFDVELWVRNLTDAHYFLDGIVNGSADFSYQPGDPRTFGVRLSAHF
jgi:iron complex outermembrane receptor protein